MQQHCVIYFLFVELLEKKNVLQSYISCYAT